MAPSLSFLKGWAIQTRQRLGTSFLHRALIHDEEQWESWRPEGFGCRKQSSVGGSVEFMYLLPCIVHAASVQWRGAR